MAISRRLEGLRSSRLELSMQNSMAELVELLPRPDSLDLLPKLRKNEGAIAEGGQEQRNGRISTPRRPQKLSIAPFDAEFHGGSFRRVPRPD